MLTPSLVAQFETAFARLYSRADRAISSTDSDGLSGQFVGGLLLGAVWSHSIGPTLGSEIALASQSANLPVWFKDLFIAI